MSYLPCDEWRRTGRRPGLAIVCGPVVAVTVTAAAPGDDGPTPDAARCRHGRLLARSAPAPSFAGVGRDLTCGYQAMSGLPSGIHVRSSGSWIVQSSSSSGDFRLERRACRPAPGALASRWRRWQGVSSTLSAAGALGGRPGASRRPGCHRRAWRAVAPWRLNEPGSVAVHPWPVVAAAALGNVFISRGRLHPWDGPISTRGMRPGGTWPPQRRDHTLSGPFCSSRWDDALGRRPGQTWVATCSDHRACA